MKNNLFLFALMALSSITGTHVSAQNFNTTQRDRLTYTQTLNDVWGYVAPDGTEYALVGARNGVSIVSLADPDNVVEVDFINGDANIWRDMKTYGTRAYALADNGSNDGILSMNLRNLPSGVSGQYFSNIETTNGEVVTRAHNLFIDEDTGRLYLAGSDANNGGVLIYDIATTPGLPIFLAAAPAVYAHDVFVLDGVMYASEINDGNMTLYDVSNPMNITRMGSVTTPFSFTHNVWTDNTGTYAYTTDERGNAPTAVYDVTDPLDIELLDEFRPRRSLNNGSVPHNVHVLDNDYLVISHYSDGVEIVDASVPDNLVEVAYFDPPNSNFWGAYPFLPSGLVLGTDINKGFYVIDVDYKRAARVRGRITDRDTGLPLNNVTVTFANADGLVTGSNALGDYKTGLANAGTYTVTFSLADYDDLVLPVDMVNGVNLALDVEMVQTALPVTLQSFTAEAAGKSVSLNWTTATEIDADRFKVEHASAGQGFRVIGEVNAGGQSRIATDYAFTDSRPAAGNNYYRLRIIDLDGSFALSEVRTVAFAGPAAESTLSPNPTNRLLYLETGQTGPVTVYRQDGALIGQSTVNDAGAIDVSGLPAGHYWLRVGEEMKAFVKR